MQWVKTFPTSPKRLVCPFHLVLLFGILGLFAAPLPSPLWAANEAVSWVSPTSAYQGVTYNTVSNNALTFVVKAYNGGNPDSSFNDPVIVGFYDSLTGLPAQPQGVWVPKGSSPVTGGTAAMTFSSGTLAFGVTVTSGSNSMDVSITDGNIATGNSYPGSVGVTTSNYPGYVAAGYDTTYYLQTASGTTVAAVYAPSPTPGATDALTLTQPSGSWVTVAYASSVTNALCFAVTGVNGGYAAGGAAVTADLYFQRVESSSEPTVNYEMIVDYGNAPSGPLTDYNNPRPAYDTVYAGTMNVASVYDLNNPGNSAALTYQSGPATFSPFMTNGQVILRVWTTTPYATNPVYLWWGPDPNNNYSNVVVPYSPNNTQPVLSTLNVAGSTANPATVLDGSAVTLVDSFLNQFSSPVTQLVWLIPPNNPASGTNWSLPTAEAPNGNSANVVEPSGSTPGTITLNASSNPIAVQQTYPVTLIGTASSQDGSWPMSLVGATTSSGTAAPANSTNAVVDTLGVPGIPASFMACPVNYNSGGGAISLAWAPVTNEDPLGYALSRSPAGSSGNPFSSPVTLPSGAIVADAITLAAGTTNYVDSNAANLAGYAYTLESYNAVAQSASATSTPNPVTAFANPGTPGPVTALTGGTTVQLSWAAPASVSGSYAVTGYQVYRGASSGGEGTTPVTTVYSPAAAVTYADTPPTSPGTTYYYFLSSIDTQYSAGPTLGRHDSGPSAQVSGFPPGNPPNNAAVTLTSQSPATLTVSWTAPVNNLNPISDYYVFKQTDGGAFAAAATLTGLSWPDPAVAIGNVYDYFIEAVDSLGNVSNASATVTGQVGPAAPTGLAAFPSTAAVTLTWNSNPSSQNVVDYVLLSNGNIIQAVPATANASVTATDTSAQEGTDYGYQVEGVNNSGITGTLSAAVSSALLPLAPPGLGTSLNLSNDSVTVSWATPTPAEPNLQQYFLTQAIGTATPTTIATPGPGALNYVDTSVTSADAGMTVTYSLSGQNNLTGTGPSSPVSLIVPPNAPTGLSDTVSSTAVTLAWTGRPASEGVTQYTVYRVSPGPVTAVAGTTAAGVTTYTDNSASLTAGVNYVYYVTAQNGGGAGLPSASVTAALLPQAPSSLTLTVQQPGTQFNVAVTWTAPAASGNLTGYNLLRNTSDTTTGATTLLSGAATGTTNYADTTIALAQAGTTFFYFVQATDVSGAGAFATAGAQIPPDPPGTPTPTSSSSAVTLNWTANAASQNVTFYTVYRNGGSGYVSIGAALSPATTFTDTTASAGVNYDYEISATDPGGGAGVPGGESLKSSPVTWGLSPQTPKNLGATILDTSNDIGVTWSPVDADATGVTLLGNTVDNSSTAAATNLAGSAVSFTYAAQSPDTTYYYWLQAVNPYGTGALAGPVSQLTYPAAVSLDFVHVDADGSRSVSWTTVGSGDVTSYVIYREIQGGSSFVSVGSATAAGLSLPVTLDIPVDPGEDYYYEVAAVNATGQGPSANVVTVGIPPSDPSPVTAASGVGIVTEVNLSWAAVAGQGVTGYTVYRGTTATWPAPVTVATGIALTNYLDASAGLSGGTTYYYWVEADSSDGVESLPTTATSSVTVVAYALPNAPTGLAETDGNASASLAWTAATATTYPIAGYNLYDSANGGATVKANATPVPGSPFTVGGLANGSAYTLWAQAVDSKGDLSAYSAPVTAFPVAPPGLPGNVAASSGNNEDQVAWSPSTAGSLPVSYYLIQKVAGGGVTTYIQVAAGLTGYVDSAVTNTGVYTYSVEAVDDSGVTTGSHVSGFTSPQTVTTGQIGINPASQVSATGGNNQVVLKWTDSVGSSSPVTGYNLYRAASASGPYSALASPATVAAEPNGYTDSTAVNGATYYYYLVSIANGTTVVSADSATVLGTPAAPPAAPTPVAESDGNASVTLNWTASPNEGAVTIAKYAITQDIPPAAATTLGATTGPVTTYTDGTVSNGETVVYQVMAVNSNGTTGAASAAVTGYPYAPLTPTGFNSVDSATAVTLSWTAPAVVTWSPLSAYTVVRTSLAGGAPVTFSIASTSYTDTTAALAQLYLYTVTATDAKGHVSAPAGPVTDGPAIAPAAPATLIATAGDQQVLLDWSASAAVSGSLPVSWYLLSLNGAAPITLPATQTWYLDSGIPNGAPVTAVLEALDETDNPTGNHLSAPVTGGPATSAAADLNPPTGLSATALGPNSVQLTWTRPNDEGYIVTAYALYRASSFTTVLGSPITTLANPPLSPVTVYNDGSVSPNSAYYYVMTAIYQQGASQVASPPSNHASVTTPAPAKPASPVTMGEMGFDANLLKPLTGQVLTIYFEAPGSGPAQFNIYNVMGIPIRALYATAEAGVQQTVTWDGKDRKGNTVASGLYLIEIRGPGIHLVRKVLVIK